MAADREHAEAYYSLAVLDGDGVSCRIEEETGLLFIKAAELRSIPPQVSLGFYYAVGEVIGKKDIVESAKWYGKAAAAGNITGQFEFGLMCVYGEGIPPDPARGLELLEAAAQKGHEDAMRALISIYDHGEPGILPSP